MIKSVLPFITVCLLMSSCGSDKPAEENEGVNHSQTEEVTKPKEEIKEYSVVDNTLEVKFTGFKLAAKTGVTGQFMSYDADVASGVSKVSDLLLNASISIDINSTKTGDEGRDGKIINSFFGTMDSTDFINVLITEVSGNTEGSATAEIKLNNVSKKLPMEWSYNMEIKKLVLKGNMNVPDWDAQAALDTLNSVCEAKHKGDGDKAITWPDVDIVAYCLVEEKIIP